MSKRVTFSSKNQIRETPRNRTIEIKQRIKNLVLQTKVKLKRRFPNGIQPYLEEKAELEKKTNGHEIVSYRMVAQWDARIEEIDQENIRFENLNYIINHTKDYIEDLDKYRRDSGKQEARKEKRLKHSMRSSSPTSLNTNINTRKSKGGSKKYSRYTRRKN